MIRAKRVFLTLAAVLLLAARVASEPALLASESYDYEPVYKLNTILDPILITGGALSWVGGLWWENSLDIPTDRTYNKSDVNAFDRVFMPNRGYSLGLDITGGVSCGINIALPVITYVISAARREILGGDAMTLTVMYVETLLWSQGFKTILKAAVHRVRPYMYEGARPDGWADGTDFSESFPSGHTTSAFAGASFLTYTFCKYYPDSNWKIPVIIASYAVATATGVLRVASANHFVTDVLAGAALGAVCGIGVPLLHEIVARVNDNDGKRERGDVEVTAWPLGANINIAL